MDDSGVSHRQDEKLARACDTCRRRKVKCSGPQTDTPACSNCVKHGVVCTYNDGTRKRGPPRGYVEELEKRLATLEAQLKKQNGRAHTQGATPPRAGSTSSSASSPPETASGRPELVDEEELLASMRQWNISGHYHGRSSLSALFTAYDSIRSRATTKPTNPALQGAQPAPPSFIERVFETEVRHDMQALTLPEGDLVQHLFDCFFNKVSPHVPIIHRPSFERQYASGLAATSSSFRSLVFAIMASGARYSDDPRTLHMYPWVRHPASDTPDLMARGYSFLFAALKLVYTLAPTSLYTLQALTLLSEYIVQAGSVLIGWAVMGWTARQFVTSGAHCLINPGWQLQLLLDECRKRTFWYFYVLDRSMSLNLGRPFALPDDIIDVDLPLDIDDATLDYYDRLSLPVPRTIPNLHVARTGKLAALRSLATISRLFERVVEVLYSAHPGRGEATRNEVIAMQSVLDQWLEDLPSELRWNPADDDITLGQSGTVLCAYYLCLMTIHRACLFPQRRLDMDESLPIATEAAVNLSHMLDTLRSRNILNETWTYTIPTATQAGMLLLVSCYAGDRVMPLTEVDEAAFKRLTVFLTALGPTSWGASRCATGLEMSYARLKEDLARPLKRSTDKVAAPPVTLADAFWATTAQAPNVPAPDGVRRDMPPIMDFTTMTTSPVEAMASSSSLRPDSFGNVRDATLASEPQAWSNTMPNDSWLFGGSNSDWLSQMGLDGAAWSPGHHSQDSSQLLNVFGMRQ